MIDQKFELQILGETLTGQETRVAGIAARAIAAGARELSVDVALVKARIKTLKLEIAQLRRMPLGTVAANASLSQGIRRMSVSIEEMEPRLSALESLLKEYVRRRSR